MEEFRSRWVPHRIVRRAERTIVIEAKPYHSSTHSRNTDRNQRSRAYWIDRDDFERLGFARARSRKTVFYSSPEVGNRLSTTVDSLTRLDLWFPYTESDVERAFRRRALLVHPDAGGTNEEFVELQEDYRRALDALNARWR